jgi:hypothetical protein
MQTFPEVAPADQVWEFHRCRLDAAYFIERYCRVWYRPQNALGPFTLFPNQRASLALFQQGPRHLVKTHRQAGYSSLLGAYGLWKLLCVPGYCLVLADCTLRHAKEQVGRIEELRQGLPEWLRALLAVEQKSVTRISYANGSRLVAVAVSKDGLRGETPSGVWMMNSAYWSAQGDHFVTTVKGCCSVGADLIHFTTPRGRDGVFHRAWTSTNDYVRHSPKWYQDPRFSVGLRWYKEGAADQVCDHQPHLQAYFLSQGYRPTSPWYQNWEREYDYNQLYIRQELDAEFVDKHGNPI